MSKTQGYIIPMGERLPDLNQQLSRAAQVVESAEAEVLRKALAWDDLPDDLAVDLSEPGRSGRHSSNDSRGMTERVGHERAMPETTSGGVGAP